MVMVATKEDEAEMMMMQRERWCDVSVGRTACLWSEANMLWVKRMILSLDEEKEKRSRRRVRRYRLFSVSLIQNERSAVRRFRDLCSEVQQRVPLIQSNSTAWEKNEGQPKREQQSSPAVNPFACLLLALFPSLSLFSFLSSFLRSTQGIQGECVFSSFFPLLVQLLPLGLYG